MTTATAQSTTKTASTSKFAAVMRNIFIHFVKAHELQAVVLTASQDKIAGAKHMNKMADKFEATQPNLAAELRFIASRG
ncbi:hypothetical protein PQR62_22935 [Herbaspirillum lusitanum]|jgi:hypothetical protein|uniref:Phasin protein n=1 Tax=Herbaspirillum lusitanum TaxID=213312 RepID=A0ABW9AGJ0_9BURK